jgi:hypothetical protein
VQPRKQRILRKTFCNNLSGFADRHLGFKLSIPRKHTCSIRIESQAMRRRTTHFNILHIIVILITL